MKSFVTYCITTLVVALCAISGVLASEPAHNTAQSADPMGAHNTPRLVINIVVSAMRASDLDRYADNFAEGGFRRLCSAGARYTNAYYNYMHTSTPAGLATLSTGAHPAVHGVVGYNWWNYVDGSHVELINDNKRYSVDFSTGSGNYSPHRLVAPTVGDMLVAGDSRSKSVSVAVDAASAIILTGKSGMAYWAEKNQTHWTTSSAYTDQLPKWVKEYNRNDTNSYFALPRWTPIYDVTKYHNSEVAVVEGISGKSTRLLSDVNLKLGNSAYGKMCYTPAGNTMLFEFA